MQRWSGECSVAQCTVLCSPLPSSRHHPEHEHFFNHSRESTAELSGGRVSHRSVCSHHGSNSAHITIPPLSLPPYLSPSLPFLSPGPSFFFFLFSPLFSFPSPSPCPISIIRFFFFSCLCHCVICFSTFITALSLPLSSCSGWIKTFCLLRECRSCLIDQPTGRNFRQT